jgi:hypothetical protein
MRIGVRAADRPADEPGTPVIFENLARYPPTRVMH